MLEQLRSPEKSKKLSQEKIVYLGRLAINAERLGINDPITHLYQYLEKGEHAEIRIRQDIETDIAERLPKTPFANYVEFNFTNNDFVSVKDKVSMNLMTKNNLKIVSEEANKNPNMKIELERAKIESEEVDRLINWFKTANIGACQIFESLPIGSQKYAISRIYKKTSESTLEGCFVSLYNSSIYHFNEFHKHLNVDVPTSHTELDILQNNYEFYQPEVIKNGNFTDYYVSIYDQMLQINHGYEFRYGIETDKKRQIQNGIQLVRKQPGLINTYVKIIKTIAESEGITSPEIAKINNRLDTGHNLNISQNIPIEAVSAILNKVIIGIASAIDSGENDLLKGLDEPYAGTDTNFMAISHFAEQAAIKGNDYESGGCPEYSRADSANNSTPSQTDSETIALQKAFNIESKVAKNFGKPKIDVCRISSCPSRGSIWWWPDKTLVGGCSVCVDCHKLFNKGKNPEKVYQEQKKHQEELKKKLKTAA